MDQFSFPRVLRRAQSWEIQPMASTHFGGSYVLEIHHEGTAGRFGLAGSGDHGGHDVVNRWKRDPCQ